MTGLFALKVAARQQTKARDVERLIAALKAANAEKDQVIDAGLRAMAYRSPVDVALYGILH